MLRSSRESGARLAALDRVQAIIEFDLDGTILTANTNFLAAMGYELAEIVGRHHSLFVEPAQRDSADYRAFWTGLRAGCFRAGQYRRLGKNGREVWIEASYNPVLGRGGAPYRIVKFATDITRQKTADADRESRIAAINTSQAVATFDLEGTVLDANANFLGLMGYALAEVAGRHHRMFVDADHARSADYGAFWTGLRTGRYRAGQFKRLAKGGREVWIEASYNPILDASGRPYKIVKHATDVTGQVRLLGELDRLIKQNFGRMDAAIRRSNGEAAQAARAGERTTGRVAAMVSETEAVAAAIGAIAGDMTTSRIAAGQAQAQVEAIADFTGRFAAAAKAMGGIVHLIQSIAGQINLLSLNATIEAARAGEAGRGFAVVASEVKSLAHQAAQATDRITAQIDGVQRVSTQLVEALAAVQGLMETMRGAVLGTAIAIEEQNGMMRSLSADMKGVAQAVAAISGNVLAMTASIADVSAAVTSTKDAARVLARD